MNDDSPTAPDSPDAPDAPIAPDSPTAPDAPDPSWPPPTSEEAPAPARRRPPRWELAMLIAGPIVAVLVVLSIVIRFPYVIISPGAATPVHDAVKIEGAPSEETKGEILFLTVRVSSDRPNVWRLGAAWVGGDSEIVDEDEFLGGLSRKQSEKLDAVDMDLSQETAKAVALRTLGYDVPVVGAEVAAVQAKSPAEGKLEPGDVVVTVDGKPVAGPADVGTAVRAHRPGETVVFGVQRGAERLDVPVVTGDDGKGTARVGIVTTPKYRFPVQITIDPGAVSGPSAGLAFTLTILDEMTPGDLTGGQKIAVTGTIAADGTVGPVGGVPQKAVAARDAGAKLMVVPADEVNDAEKNAGAMKVVGVHNVDEALAALAAHGGQPLPALKPAA